MTPLEAATEKILSAIGRKDFGEMEQTLQERAGLLAAGAEVSQHAWDLGELACQAIISLKTDLVAESTRLEQIRKLAETLPQPAPALREYFG